MKQAEKKSAPLPFLPVSDAQAATLLRLTRENVTKSPIQGYAGVGTLGEKRMHAILKHFLCGDEDYHEVGILDTNFVADVKLGNTLYEVQTSTVFPLKPKLEHYLSATKFDVVVVHPMTYGGRITRIDPRTGEILSSRRSPIYETPLAFLADLYPLRTFLQNPRLSFYLLFMEVEDFRLPYRGRGKRQKVEKIPFSLLGQLTLAKKEDYAALIPKELPSSFSAKEFSTAARLYGRATYSALHVLAAAGALREEKEKGKPFLFTRI